MNTKPKNLIRSIYLYLVSIIALMIMIISGIGIVHLVLIEYVFDVKGYEEFDQPWECSKEFALTEGAIIDSDINQEQCIKNAEEKRVLEHANNVKRDWVTWLSMLIIGIPMYFFHWRVVRKEK